MTLVVVLALIAGLVSFWTGQAHAQTTTLTINATWTHPPTTLDGSALPPSAITATRLEYGIAGAGSGCAIGTKLADKIVSGSATTTQLAGLAIGKYWVRAYTTANGLEGPPTGVACTTSAPNAPGGLTLSVTVSVSVSAP